MLNAIIHEAVVMFSDPGPLHHIVDLKSVLRVIMLLPVMLSRHEIVRQIDHVFQYSLANNDYPALQFHRFFRSELNNYQCETENDKQQAYAPGGRVLDENVQVAAAAETFTREVSDDDDQ